jgi:hypothetical protein
MVCFGDSAGSCGHTPVTGSSDQKAISTSTGAGSPFVSGDEPRDNICPYAYEHHPRSVAAGSATLSLVVRESPGARTGDAEGPPRASRRSQRSLLVRTHHRARPRAQGIGSRSEPATPGIPGRAEACEPDQAGADLLGIHPRGALAPLLRRRGSGREFLARHQGRPVGALHHSRPGHGAHVHAEGVGRAPAGQAHPGPNPRRRPPPLADGRAVRARPPGPGRIPARPGGGPRGMGPRPGLSGTRPPPGRPGERHARRLPGRGRPGRAASRRRGGPARLHRRPAGHQRERAGQHVPGRPGSFQSLAHQPVRRSAGRPHLGLDRGTRVPGGLAGLDKTRQRRLGGFPGADLPETGSPGNGRGDGQGNLPGARVAALLPSPGGAGRKPAGARPRSLGDAQSHLEAHGPALRGAAGALALRSRPGGADLPSHPTEPAGIPAGIRRT